jgi:hypothetical protein
MYTNIPTPQKKKKNTHERQYLLLGEAKAREDGGCPRLGLVAFDLLQALYHVHERVRLGKKLLIDVLSYLGLLLVKLQVHSQNTKTYIYIVCKLRAGTEDLEQAVALLEQPLAFDVGLKHGLQRHRVIAYDLPHVNRDRLHCAS